MKSEEAENEKLRWARAATWAREQSLGPWRRLGDDAAEDVRKRWHAECERIEALRDRIVEIGEDAAWDEYEQKTERQN